MTKCVGGWNDGSEGWHVSSTEAVICADLGGSSKYSNANFEDWRGEGFHVNSICTWVSRLWPTKNSWILHLRATRERQCGQNSVTWVRISVWQQSVTRKSEGRPQQAFSVLVNTTIPWNHFVWRSGMRGDKGSRFLRKLVCLSLPLKIREVIIFQLEVVPITASGLQGE